ncbi:MAG: YidC/Oxa1 family membrane protein insertase [Patescibacteria group bacterium]|nr:YidC/Oxa1 family membrane protein insertase [Patescibacteria group bacterium]
MIQLFNTIFYEPIFNTLVWLYNVVPGYDIGVAIIILTIILKILLFPLNLQSLRSQKAMQDIQPKINEIKKRLKDKKDEMSKAIMQLYRSEKVNPFSSCLPLLIQLPFLIALYRVLLKALNSEGFEVLYPFIVNPGQINPIAFGFVNLAEPHNIPLALLAGVAQFFQGKMMITSSPHKEAKKDPGSKDEAMLGSMNKQMLYFMPAITVFIGYSLPGGLILYWFVMNLLTIVQQWFFLKKKHNTNTTQINTNDTN